MNNDFNNGQGFGGGLSYQGPGVPQQPIMNQGMDMNQQVQQPMMNQGMGMNQQVQQPMMNQGMGMNQQVNQGMDMIGQGLSYQGPGVPQQPVMQQPMTQPAPDMNMAQQPMMQQQPMMNQGMVNPGMGENPVPPKANNKNLILLIPAAMVVIVILVILINVIGTKTLKCTAEEDDYGVAIKSETSVKYKFGKPKKTTLKTVTDYSDSDVSNSDLDDAVEESESSLKKSCKSSDGCSYSVKRSGKKITVTKTSKVTKEDLEGSDDYDYDSTSEHLESLGFECK